MPVARTRALSEGAVGSPDGSLNDLRGDRGGTDVAAPSALIKAECAVDRERNANA